MIISNEVGTSVFSKSAGCLDFKHMQKRSPEAFQALLTLGLQKLLTFKGVNQFLLVLEGVKKFNLKLVQRYFIRKLQQFKVRLKALEFLDKTAHNGCRKKSA